MEYLAIGEEIIVSPDAICLKDKRKQLLFLARATKSDYPKPLPWFELVKYFTVLCLE